MSFLRPEARATLLRWREVAATGLLTIWGVWLIGRAVDRGSLTLGILAALVTALGTGLLFLALLRLRLAGPGKAAGVVQVDEREIGYLAPEGGAFVSLDDLTRLEFLADRDGRHWVLTHLGGPALVIPANAAGAERLIDAFASLPGLRLEDAARAAARGRGRTLIWARAIA